MKKNLLRIERGFASIAVTVVILIGIVLATYLALHQQIFNPHASDNQTRVEFIDSNGNIITQTSSRNVILKITYVPLSIPVAPASGNGNSQSASVPGSSVSVSGSSTVTSSGGNDVNVQFSGPSASVGGGSTTSSSSHQVSGQTTTTVTQNGQTTTTTTTSGSPLATNQVGQFPTAFRVSNSLAGLSSAESVDFTQNGQQVNWLLDGGDGLKTVYVEFKIGGFWQGLTIGTITLSSPQAVTGNSQFPSASPLTSNGGAQTGGLASFILREGTPTPVSGTSSTNSVATPNSLPAATPQVSGGIVTSDGTATGGKITLPNGRVIQGGSAGNGTATNGTISSPLPTAQPDALSQQSAGSPSVVDVPIQLLVQSDTDAANLFSAKLLFDASKFQVDRIDTSGSFVNSWVTNVFDNNAGTISLVGGVSNPGFKTSGIPAVMATIYLRSFGNGAPTLSFDPSSAIYRDADNVDILHSSAPVQSSSGSSGGDTNTPVESPLPVQQPTAAPVIPTAFPSSAPTSLPTAVSSSSTTVTNSTGNSASDTSDTQCVLDQTNFSTEQASSGTAVTVTATGSTACNGQTVTFEVNQDNGLLGQQQVDNPPPPATFDNGQATSTWVTQSNNGALGGLFGSSGYSLSASLPDTSQTVTSGQNLKVDKSLSTGGFKKGDVNHDGSITLDDLSAFLSDFGAGKGVPEMDMNNDGVINSIDFSALIALLKQQGVTQ